MGKLTKWQSQQRSKSCTRENPKGSGGLQKFPLLRERVKKNRCPYVLTLSPPTKVNCLLYADELLHMSSSEHGLQQCLNKLNDYTKKWKLRVNLKKTKLIIFNKSGRKLNASCSFGSKTVDMATSYTYLGSVLTPSGSFSANQDQLYNKGLRTMFTLLKDFHPLNGTPVRIFLKLFDSMIRPVLL